MADRRERLLIECRAAVRARRARAEAAHGTALRAVADADVARVAADAALTRAGDAWTRQMQAGFDPTLGSLLARTMLEQATQADAAAERHDNAVSSSSMSARDWQHEEFRCRAVEDQATAARRRAARRAEDRHLCELEDRLTFAWSVS